MMPSKNFLSLAATLTLVLSGCSPSGPQTSGMPETIRLPARVGGEAAIKALGTRLAAVATSHRMSEESLRALFRSDDSLKVDRDGRLHFAEPLARADLGDGSLPFDPTPDLIPSSETFVLHSRAGSAKKVYLSFRGGRLEGTPWGDPAIDYAPYSMDTDPSFSEAELREVRAIWLAIAEEYAPFDVDVTTEKPGDLRAPKTVEIAFTPSSEWYGAAGGVCYMNAIDWENQRRVCWVFSTLLGNRTHWVAQAGAHEMGHALGLRHWAQFAADGSQIASYYVGHGAWAPIMGVGYYRPVTSWSKGEYAGAGTFGLGILQDDIAVIAEKIGFVPDEAGDTAPTAAPLARENAAPDAPVRARGILHSAADRDVYRLDLGSTGLQLRVGPAAFAPNADFSVRLVDSFGTEVFSNNPESIAPVDLALPNLATGIYFLEISASGFLDPATTGYSTYGSIGQYYITGNYIRGPSEGGDLEIIGSATGIEDLSRHCDVGELAASFVTDSRYGIGWGAPAVHSDTNPDGHNPIPAQMQCCRIRRLSRIRHVHLKVKTPIDANESSRGYLYVSRPIENATTWGDFSGKLSQVGLLSSMDAWGRAAWGNNSVVDHVTPRTLVAPSQTTDGEAVLDVDYDADGLDICMAGDTAPAVYAPRFIQELRVRTD